MATVASLKALYVAAAANIINDIDRETCLLLLNEWEATRTALASAQATDISGYSIAQRSVQRRAIQEMESTETKQMAQIRGYLYGPGGGVVDQRFGRDDA